MLKKPKVSKVDCYYSKVFSISEYPNMEWAKLTGKLTGLSAFSSWESTIQSIMQSRSFLAVMQSIVLRFHAIRQQKRAMQAACMHLRTHSLDLWGPKLISSLLLKKEGIPPPFVARVFTVVNEPTLETRGHLSITLWNIRKLRLDPGSPPPLVLSNDPKFCSTMLFDHSFKARSRGGLHEDMWWILERTILIACFYHKCNSFDQRRENDDDIHAP